MKTFILALLVLGAFVFWVFGSPEVMFEENIMPKALRLDTPTPAPRKESGAKASALSPTFQVQSRPNCTQCIAWTLDGQEVRVARWEVRKGMVVADVKDLDGNPVYGVALVDPDQWQPMPTALAATPTTTLESIATSEPTIPATIPAVQAGIQEKSPLPSFGGKEICVGGLLALALPTLLKILKEAVGIGSQVVKVFKE